MKRQRVQSLSQGTLVFGRSALRGISYVVLTSYLALISAPAAAAVRQEVFGRPKPLTEHAIAESELAQMREAMRQFRLEQHLAARASESMTDKLKTLFSDSPKVKAEKAVAETLLASRAQLQDEAKQQDQELAATRESLLKKHLPAVILARHDAAVQTIAQRRAELYSQLDRLQQAQAKDDDAARRQVLDVIDQKLEAWGGKQQVKTDYKHLPWGSPDSKVRAPHDSKVAYSLNLEMFGIKPLQVAGPIPPGTVLPVLPQLPAAPQPGDLAETEDIQLTPAIRAKAAELHHNPAEINRWVHDNIEYIPTYGSIQGADYTLQTKRGNAFDTSSLLIGLLRASGIPARYVYGTVEVPIEQAKNWVGGVTSPDAVLNLMGQGGIPNTGLTLGGKIVAVRMEHVWVEAFVDFVPSRGVKNKVPDTWVPMDASFKQYAYTAPLNWKQSLPFDAQAIIQGAQQGSVINGEAGYVQNIDQQVVRQGLSDYAARVESFVSENESLTVGKVVGGKSISPAKELMLSQVLPIKLITVAADLQLLPESMRHYFDYHYYESDFAKLSDSPEMSLRISLPKLAGKSLALSFKPASTVDEDVIYSYFPRSHDDGTPIDPSEMPSGLPGYLVKVTPEISLDGQVVAAGTSVALGSDVFTAASIQSPNSSLNGVISENLLSAGEYHAIAVTGNGYSSAEYAKDEAKAGAARGMLERDMVEGLSRHDQTGLILQTVAKSYFSINDTENRSAARGAGIAFYRLPSFGTFSTTFETVYSWGVPRLVKVSGVTMDMDRVTSAVVSLGENSEAVKGWNQEVGAQLSANEHRVPEYVLGADVTVQDGMSAVKALQIAAAQGQRIYMISSANSQEAISALNLSSDVENEVALAVFNGLKVVVSQNNIQSNGWTGVGYIITDPSTGTGAYKISGGHNGGRKVWDGVLSGFSGMLDGLLKTYRQPNAMFGPDSERLRANQFNAIAKILNVITLIKNIVDILNDGQLSTTQKVVKIALTAASTIATLELGAFAATLLGPAFINPVGAVILSITAVVLVSFLMSWLIDAIVSLFANYYYRKRRAAMCQERMCVA